MNPPSSFAKVARDVLDLCELQMQLLAVDSQAAKRELVRAIVCAFVAAVLVGTALTLLLAGVGVVLAEMTQLSVGGGLLVAGGVTMAIIAILLMVAWAAVKAASASMKETKSEFAENLRWLKATLVSPQTSARNQIRSESFSRNAVNRSVNSPPSHPYHPEPVSPLPPR